MNDQQSSAEAMRVRFWGVRGSIPTPGPATVRYGGNTSCVEVRAGGEIIILDAGTGIRLLGRALAAEFQDRPIDVTLLLTHTHWDHIHGLPFFAPLYAPQNHIRIIGYEGARNTLANALTSQMESPYFPVGFTELSSNVEVTEMTNLEFQVGAVRVEAFFANHPGVCVGYRVHHAGRSVTFFPDNEPREWREHFQEGKLKFGETAFIHAETYDARLVSFISDTDVLILDAQYDCEEYKRRIGWGHGCVDDAVKLALKGKVRRLFLFHHDPDHDDDKIDAMLAHAKANAAQAGGELEVEAAREGLTVFTR